MKNYTVIAMFLEISLCSCGFHNIQQQHSMMLSTDGMKHVESIRFEWNNRKEAIWLQRLHFQNWHCATQADHTHEYPAWRYVCNIGRIPPDKHICFGFVWDVNTWKAIKQVMKSLAESLFSLHTSLIP